MSGIVDNYHLLVGKFQKIEKESTEKEIHDKRVILRKIFPILAAYKINPAKVKNGEKAFKLFGKLRDVQVQLIKLESVELPPEIIPYLEYLKKSEIKRKEEVRKFTKKKKLSFPLIKKKSAIDISKIIRKAEKSLNKIIRMVESCIVVDAEYIHKVRIEFKKFRYQIEILSIISLIDEEKLERIRLYQDKLGEIQDYEVLINGIIKFNKKHKSVQDENIDVFEENQNKLMNEFEQDQEVFIQICKDVLPLSGEPEKLKEILVCADEAVSLNIDKITVMIDGKPTSESPDEQVLESAEESGLVNQEDIAPENTEEVALNNTETNLSENTEESVVQSATEVLAKKTKKQPQKEPKNDAKEMTD
jgi:CHAD domain-containing protein